MFKKPLKVYSFKILYIGEWIEVCVLSNSRNGAYDILFNNYDVMYIDSLIYKGSQKVLQEGIK